MPRMLIGTGAQFVGLFSLLDAPKSIEEIWRRIDAAVEPLAFDLLDNPGCVRPLRDALV